jgi:uncharacterized protein YbjT (DUF2867 family)
MSGTVLVAGASGALGAHVARTLALRGEVVRVLVRDPARVPADLRGKVDVVVGDALRPATLAAATKDVTALFSSVGASALPGLRGWSSYYGVDVPANRNLLAAAEAAGTVEKIVYVSCHHDAALRRTGYVDAHERVAALLAASGIPSTIVRPTGFFTALSVFVDLAKKGPVPEIGDGNVKTNPIDDADLARVCVEALASKDAAIPCGGPDVLTRHEIAALACEAVGKPVRVRRMPPWLMRFGAAMLRPFHPRMSHLLAFVTALHEHDLVAPVHGTRHLSDCFRERAARPG